MADDRSPAFPPSNRRFSGEWSESAKAQAVRRTQGTGAAQLGAHLCRNHDQEREM